MGIPNETVENELGEKARTEREEERKRKLEKSLERGSRTASQAPIRSMSPSLLRLQRTRRNSGNRPQHIVPPRPVRDGIYHASKNRSNFFKISGIELTYDLAQNVALRAWET